MNPDAPPEKGASDTTISKAPENSVLNTGKGLRKSRQYTLRPRGVKSSVLPFEEAGASARADAHSEGRRTSAAGAKHLPLTKRHNSPPQTLSGDEFCYPLTVWEEGSLSKIEKPKFDPEVVASRNAGKLEAGIRDKCIGFSSKSRLNLKRNLAKVSKDVAAFFACLTYPAEFPDRDNFPIYKRHLDSFNKRLARRYPKAAGFWRIELQPKRGAPHYHLIIYGVDMSELDDLKKWMLSSWYEVVKSEDMKHLKHGVDLQAAGNGLKASAYIAKYISKEEEDRWGEVTMGRPWGKFNTECIPIAPESEILLIGEEANKVARVIQKKIKSNQKVAQTRLFSSLYGNGESILQHDYLRTFKGFSFLKSRMVVLVPEKNKLGELRYAVASSMVAIPSFLMANRKKIAKVSGWKWSKRRTRNNPTVYLFGGVGDVLRYAEYLISQRSDADKATIRAGEQRRKPRTGFSRMVAFKCLDAEAYKNSAKGNSPAPLGDGRGEVPLGI